MGFLGANLGPSGQIGVADPETALGLGDHILAVVLEGQVRHPPAYPRNTPTGKPDAPFGFAVATAAARSLPARLIHP